MWWGLIIGLVIGTTFGYMLCGRLHNAVERVEYRCRNLKD